MCIYLFFALSSVLILQDDVVFQNKFPEFGWRFCGSVQIPPNHSEVVVGERISIGGDDSPPVIAVAPRRTLQRVLFASFPVCTGVFCLVPKKKEPYAKIISALLPAAAIAIDIDTTSRHSWLHQSCILVSREHFPSVVEVSPQLLEIREEQFYY